MIFRNVAQLASAVGNGTNIESVSRAIYKGTDCGEWVDLRQVKQHKPTQFKVTFGDSILGVVAHSWQKNGRGTYHNFDEVSTPKELVDYLSSVPEPRLRGPQKKLLVVTPSAGKTIQELRFNTRSNKQVKWFPKRHNTAWVSVCISVPGIGIGSIVEGVDECTETQKLAFPFTEKKFWAAVTKVEKQAEAIWNDTHGCSDCGDENPETGYTPVNPKCKTCKGQGISI